MRSLCVLRVMIVSMVTLLVVFCGEPAYATSAEVRFDETFLTPQQREEDFEHLFRVINTHYPYFWQKRRLGYVDWRSEKLAFKKMMSQAKTPEAYYRAVRSILWKLHNLHSGIVGQDTAQFYATESAKRPLREAAQKALPAAAFWDEVGSRAGWSHPRVYTHYLNGRYYLGSSLRLPDGTELSIGAEVASIDDLAVDEHIRRYRDQMYLQRDLQTGGVISWGLFRMFDEGDELSIQLKNPTRSLRFTADAMEEVVPCFEHVGWLDHGTTVDLVSNEVGYIKLNTFSSEREELDFDILADFLDAHEDARAIIIDIRGNGGGSTRYWREGLVSPTLHERLQATFFVGIRSGEYDGGYEDELVDRYGLERVDRQNYLMEMPSEVLGGVVDHVYAFEYRADPERAVRYGPKIYLLVDRYVYSSSEALAAWAKATGWAVLVGEQTGGDGIGFDPSMTVLPNSLMLIRYPFDMGMSPDGSMSEEMRTTPDIRTSWSIGDWRQRCERIGADMVSDEDEARTVLLQHDPDVRAVLNDLGL